MPRLLLVGSLAVALAGCSEGVSQQVPTRPQPQPVTTESSPGPRWVRQDSARKEFGRAADTAWSLTQYAYSLLGPSTRDGSRYEDLPRAKSQFRSVIADLEKAEPRELLPRDRYPTTYLRADLIRAVCLYELGRMTLQEGDTLGAKGDTLHAIEIAENAYQAALPHPGWATQAIGLATVAAELHLLAAKIAKIDGDMDALHEHVKRRFELREWLEAKKSEQAAGHREM